MRSVLVAGLVSLAVGAGVGCNSAKPYTFDVSVRNATDQPLTVGFVKRGPPFDPRWASPEEFTDLPPSRQPTHWGVVIPPGRTMATRETAEMSPGADPVIRVYLGDRPYDELLAVSRGGGGRIDLSIRPGPPNDYVVTNDPPKGLAAKVARLAPPPHD